MKSILMAGSCLVLAACASNFETRKYDPVSGQPVAESAADPSTKPVENGLVYYEPRLFRVTYSFMQRVDGAGNLTGAAADRSCRPVVQKDELQTLPDYANPRLIVNKPPPFTPGKFTVNLANGMLTSLNMESSPNVPQLIQSLIKPLDLQAMEMAPAGDACNAGPSITAITRVVQN